MAAFRTKYFRAVVVACVATPLLSGCAVLGAGAVVINDVPAGVTVVGIDNGFGAASAVARILGRRQ